MKAFDILLDVNGRVSRSMFWLVVGFLIVVSFLAAGADHMLGLYSLETDSGPIQSTASILLLWPSLANSIKRFHDRGQSGWWVLWFFLMTTAPVIVLIIFGLQQNIVGDPEPNFIGWVMMAILAIVQITQVIILGFLPGQKGENRFGPDPVVRKG